MIPSSTPKTPRNAARLPIALLSLLLAPALSGCLVAGYRTGGGWFVWPGSFGFLIVLLLLFLFLRRGR